MSNEVALTLTKTIDIPLSSDDILRAVRGADMTILTRIHAACYLLNGMKDSELNELEHSFPSLKKTVGTVRQLKQKVVEDQLLAPRTMSSAETAAVISQTPAEKLAT